METITVEVWLYGPLARYAGDHSNHICASQYLTLPADSRMRDLLAKLSLPTEERGITFVNGDLSAMPNLQPDLDQLLADGDRVAFFHLKAMWPAQYRHGAALAEGMSRAAQDRGIFHHRSNP
jgi:hypothetical protein